MLTLIVQLTMECFAYSLIYFNVAVEQLVDLA